MKNELTPERLRELLSYDPETGVFTHISKRPGVKFGSIAGTKHKLTGYLVTAVDGRYWLCHRLAWLYVTGRLPEHEIDHINGLRDDNRIANLRDVTRRINQQNIRAAQKSSVSGLIGASYDPSTRKWRARIRVYDEKLGKAMKKNIGSFSSAEEASAAFIAAKRISHIGNTL